MTLAGEAARGAAITLVAQWLRFVVQIVALGVLGRLLSAADFGVISMVTAVAGVATLIGDFGLSQATIQAKKLSTGQRNNLFWMNTALGVVAASLVFVLAHPIAAFFDQPNLVAVTRAFSVIFLVSAVTSQFRAEATRRMRFVPMALTDIGAQVLATAAAIAAALGGLGYWALVIQQIVAVSATLVALVIVAAWFPGLPARREPMRALLTFGGNTLGVQLVNYASANVDNLVIGKFQGPVDLGFYDRAFQLFRMPLAQIAAPMTRVAFPVLSKLQDDQQAFDRYLQRAQLVLCYVMAGAFFLAALFADPIIELVMGPGWDRSKLLFRILAIGGVFQAIGYSYFWVFLAKGKTGLQLRYSVIGRLIMVALICVGVIWGTIGVAIGSVAGLLVNWLILTIFAMPRTGIDVRALVTVSVRPVGAFSAMLALLLPVALFVSTRCASWIQVLVLAASTLLYWALLALFSRSVRGDLGLLWDTVRHARRG